MILLVILFMPLAGNLSMRVCSVFLAKHFWFGVPPPRQNDACSFDSCSFMKGLQSLMLNEVNMK